MAKQAGTRPICLFALLVLVSVPCSVQAAAAEIPIRVHNRAGRRVAAFPFTMGVPFARGALRPNAPLALFDAEGRPVPVQALTTATWDKDASSIRWLLLDFVTTVEPGGHGLILRTDGTRAASAADNVASETSDAIMLDTGQVRLAVSRKRFSLFDQVWADLDGNGRYEAKEALLDEKAERGPYVRDGKGRVFWAAADPRVKVVIEENGPVKAVVMAKGFYTSRATGSPSAYCQFIVRITAHRGLSWVRTDQTFVFTEDSDKGHVITDLGCRLPLRTSAREYAFGVADGGALGGSSGQETVSLYQRDHDWFQLGRYDGAKKLEVLSEGKRGTGRVSLRTDRARITAGVEDFWQQFPKELSVNDRKLTVHFWPAHGELNPRWALKSGSGEAGEKEAEKSPDGLLPELDGKALRPAMPEQVALELTHERATEWLYRLPWVHEGAALGFRMPARVAQFGNRPSGDFRYVKRGQPANGMGVAKTHRVYFDFGTAASSPAACPLNVEDQPYAHVHPKQIHDSRAMGALWPRDPQRFPAAERVLDDLGRWMASLPHKLRDYGMWHWACGHQYLNPRTRLPSLPRVWVNTHDGRPRWPWVLYARSGDPTFRAAALRMTRHCTDVAICHYSTPEYNEGRRYASNAKQVGGTCDYKGLVPWNAGDRFTYNSGVDWYLWHYYLTGDRRAWEVAMEHGAYVASKGCKKREREGSARAAAMLAMYHATREQRYLDKAAGILNGICHSIVNADREGYGSIQYHPHWERALDTPELGQSLLDRIHEAVILRAEDELTGGFFNSSTRFSHHKLMGLAYRLTKDPRYLAWGDAMNQWLDWSRYTREDELFAGYVAWAINLGTLSYYLQRIPYHLSARASHEGAVPDYTPPFMIHSASHFIVRKTWPPTEGRTRVGWRGIFPRETIAVSIKNAGGEEVHRQEVIPDESGRKPISPAIAFDFPNRLPPGDYSIALSTAKGAPLPIRPWLPLPRDFPFKQVVMAIPGLGRDETFGIGRGLLYFFVPKGTDKLDFFSRHGDSRYIAMLRIERPAPGGWEDVARLGAIMWPDKRQVTARVRPGDDGKIWRFFHTGALAGASRADASLWLRTPGVPLVVADQPQRFFAPQTSLIERTGE